MKVLQKLAIKLIALRVERQLTVEDVATSTYIDSAALEDIEASRREPTFGELYRLSSFYSMDPVELIASLAAGE